MKTDYNKSSKYYQTSKTIYYNEMNRYYEKTQCEHPPPPNTVNEHILQNPNKNYQRTNITVNPTKAINEDRLQRAQKMLSMNINYKNPTNAINKETPVSPANTINECIYNEDKKYHH